MMCVVQKEFTGAGENFVRNQLIDGSQFRNEQVLITQRFLRPATPEDIQSAERLMESEPAAPPVPRKKGAGIKVKVAKRRH